LCSPNKLCGFANAVTYVYLKARILLCNGNVKFMCFLKLNTRKNGSINKAGLEDATNTKSHGNQRLHVQWWKAPDDGHNGVRNM
jgi:hypothetical protein